GLLVALTEEDRLRGPRAAVRLHPAPVRAAGRNERAMPEADVVSAQRRVRHLEDDAAHVLVREEVAAGELEFVEGALGVEEERVAPPAGEEPVLPGVRHLRLRAHRHRRVLDDDLSALACAGRLRAFDAANRGELHTART